MQKKYYVTLACMGTIGVVVAAYFLEKMAGAPGWVDFLINDVLAWALMCLWLVLSVAFRCFWRGGRRR